MIPSVFQVFFENLDTLVKTIQDGGGEQASQGKNISLAFARMPRAAARGAPLQAISVLLAGLMKRDMGPVFHDKIEAPRTGGKKGQSPFRHLNKENKTAVPSSPKENLLWREGGGERMLLRALD